MTNNLTDMIFNDNSLDRHALYGISCF